VVTGGAHFMRKCLSGRRQRERLHASVVLHLAARDGHFAHAQRSVEQTSIEQSSQPLVRPRLVHTSISSSTFFYLVRT
jgi:hypothetical protein